MCGRVMFSQIALILFGLVYSSYSEDCIRQNLITQEDAWDKKLHKEIMENYRYNHPPSNQSCVYVKVHFQMKTFSFDEYEDKFTAKMWTRMIWNDERLIWSPNDYGGVSKLVVHPSDIWRPNLNLLNSVDPDLFSVDIEECIVFNTGQLMCVPEIIYESFCSSKLKDWPFDVQNCTLQFGDGDRFTVTRFHFMNRVMSLFPAEYGNGWNIMLLDSKQDPNSEIQLSITLTLERQASGLVIILIGPSIILCILTIASILMNVTDYIRLGLSCFSLICHFYILYFIDMFLPKHSSDTPVILFFIRNSILLAITSVLVTIVLGKIVKRKSVPYAWVSLVSDKIFCSFARYLIFPRWGTNCDSEDINVKNREIWTNLGNVLNSVYLFIVIIVYIIWCNVYMPNLPPAEY